MKSLTFKDLAVRVLEEEGRPLNVEEIWKIAQKKGYDKLVKTQGKTPWRSIGARIYVDIKNNPDSPFIKIKSKPPKFFLKDLASSREIIEIEKKDTVRKEVSRTLKFHERALHPFLTYFAYVYMGIYTKTIFHEKSNKKRYAQWLHPDIVGVYFPVEKWNSEVLDFAKEIGSPPITLYSFELKKELGFHNLRESFFQAVSNSSWANEGYLVTAKIEQDEDFMNELNRLSTSFGIGVITLDIDDPDSSNIILPAKNKVDLDWETINKLSEDNSDFRNFLRGIKIDLFAKEVRKERYDKVYDSEALIDRIKK